MPNDIFHALCIYRTAGIGPVKFNNLIAAHGSLDAAADTLNLSQDFKDSILREMEALDKIGGFYISSADEDFPQSLRCAHGCAPILSVVGNRKTLTKKTFGCVGTRHASSSGMNLMHGIAKRLAENNCAVVSGMAMGTDSSAHIGALDADGDTNTIAVFAGGVDYVWPPENQILYERIKERGCVVSEMPIGVQPLPRQFAHRDKIIAALSDQLVLGESNEGSGSLITANFTLSLGRRIHAIPSHPSDPRSYGSNKLIREGKATLCRGADDFFPELELDCCVVNTKTADSEGIEGCYGGILDFIGSIPITESDLSLRTGKNISIIKTELAILEMQNRIERASGGIIRRT
ncbi:MAG: DNA-protecting protein DprA [Rickettsiales bacterium]|jgi:DNA processing protein|nr:DNA-protecting protein DprA [Rickettsiales bacterium]